MLRPKTNVMRIDGASLCEDQQIVRKSLMSSQWMDHKTLGDGRLGDQENDHVVAHNFNGAMLISRSITNSL